MRRTCTLSFVVLSLLGLSCKTTGPVPLESSTVPAPTTDVADAPEVAEQPVDLDEDPHLVGWWKFDETSGSTAKDSSSYGRDGALIGDLSFDKNSEPGRIGMALRLEGSDEEYVEITGYKGVTGTRARTVVAWVRTSRPRGQIVSWGRDEGGKMWIVGFIRSGFGVTPEGGYLYGETGVDDDDWHQLAVVIGEAELPNLHDDAKLYVDGGPEEIDGIGLLDLWPVDTAADMDVRIGFAFRGLIDELRIYDRPLSEEEISALYRSDPAGRSSA